MNPSDPVEFNLLLHQVGLFLQWTAVDPEQLIHFPLPFPPQAIDDVVSDRFPVSLSEATYLAALRAQVVLGGLTEEVDLMDYL